MSLTIWDLLLRLGIASLCGGLIGIERGRKHRAAGFRTHMLVCMGAALTMILSTYLCVMIQGEAWSQNPLMDTMQTDVSRFGAQVINGIGFIGAGTILVTGRQQVRGMTTAAGLWASACMGLSIGAGFYAAALIGCALIVLTIAAFTGIERTILARSRNLNLYVSFEHSDDLAPILKQIRENQVRILDVEIQKSRGSDGFTGALFSLLLPKKQPHTRVLTAIAEVEGVRSIEEV